MDGVYGVIKPVPHNFAECLRLSHEAEDLPLWETVYRKAFPDMVAMISHRQDGDHQRQGIDRSIILNNSKQVLIDEKVRGKNGKTGRVYEDIALEFLSDSKRNVPGWVCKPLLADYIAYAIAPLGKCYLLPVIQLQQAWAVNQDKWTETYFIANAVNRYAGREWVTQSCCVPVNVLFSEIGKCLRVDFDPFDFGE